MHDILEEETTTLLKSGQYPVRNVVQKFIIQLEGQLAERNVQIEITDRAADWLAPKGYDESFGARPLARLIQEKVKKRIESKGKRKRLLLRVKRTGAGAEDYQALPPRQ